MGHRVSPFKLLWADLGVVVGINGGSQIRCLKPTSKYVSLEGNIGRVKLGAVAGMQGGLGRAGVLIECHNLLLLPFHIHIFAPRLPAPFLSGKCPTRLPSLLAKNL